MPYVPGWLKRSERSQYWLFKAGPACFYCLNFLILVCAAVIFALSCVSMYHAHTLTAGICACASGLTVLATFSGNIIFARRMQLFIWVYAVLLGVFILYNVVAIILIVSAVEKQRIKDTIYKKLYKRLHWYLITNSTMKRKLDRTQQNFKCCGLEGPDDFIDDADFEFIPESCCADMTLDCNIYDAYPKSCREAIYEYMELLALIKLCLGCVQILIMIAAIILTLCFWWVLNHMIEEDEKKRRRST